MSEEIALFQNTIRKRAVLKQALFSQNHYQILIHNKLNLYSSHHALQQFFNTIELYENSWMERILISLQHFYSSNIYMIYKFLKGKKYFQHENDWITFKNIAFENDLVTLEGIIRLIYHVESISNNQKKQCIKLILQRAKGQKLIFLTSIYKALHAYKECWNDLKDNHLVLLDKLLIAEKNSSLFAPTLVASLIPITKSGLLDLNNEKMFKILNSGPTQKYIHLLLNIMYENNLLQTHFTALIQARNLLRISWYIFISNQKVISTMPKDEISQYLDLLAESNDPLRLANELVQLYSIDLLNTQTKMMVLKQESCEDLFYVYNLFLKAKIKFPKSYINHIVSHPNAKDVAKLIATLFMHDQRTITNGEITCDLKCFFSLQEPKHYYILFNLLGRNNLLLYNNCKSLILYENIFTKVNWSAISCNLFLTQEHLDEILNIARSSNDENHSALLITNYLTLPRERLQTNIHPDCLFNVHKLYSKAALSLSDRYHVEALTIKNIYEVIYKHLMTDMQHSKDNSEKTETLNKAINSLKILHKQSRQYINRYSGLSLHQLLKLYWFAIHDQEALQQSNCTVKDTYAIFIRFLSNIEFDIFEQTCSPHSIFNQLISTLMGIHPLVSHLNYVALPNNLFSKINIDTDENEVRPFSDHESEDENSNKSFLL